MRTTNLTVADAHVGLARKYNHFEDQGHAVEGHACGGVPRAQWPYPRHTADKKALSGG